MDYPHDDEWRSSMGFDLNDDNQDYLPVYPTKPKVTPATVTVKKKKVPSAVSVSDYVLMSKKSDQTTLTQIYKHAPTSPFEDSDDDFVPKKRKARVTPDRYNLSILPEKKRLKSHKRNKVPDLAQFGDLVTSSVKELNHHRYLSGDVDPGYMMFGVVKGGDKDTVLVAWNDVEPALKHFVSVNSEPNYMDYVSPSLVRVVGKYDDPNLCKMNNFLCATIYHQFRFRKGIGWVKFAWI